MVRTKMSLIGYLESDRKYFFHDSYSFFYKKTNKIFHRENEFILCAGTLYKNFLHDFDISKPLENLIIDNYKKHNPELDPPGIISFNYITEETNAYWVENKNIKKTKNYKKIIMGSVSNFFMNLLNDKELLNLNDIIFAFRKTYKNFPNEVEFPFNIKIIDSKIEINLKVNF
jgi:hypothetical protein